MLDRTDFASWKQYIRLYCRGKENGMNILKSIDEGPFQMGTFRETLAKEKDRYNADIRATNILLQGLPKDIYTIINQYTDAKDIWDNVKMLLEDKMLLMQAQENGVALDEELLLFIAGGQDNAVDEDVDEQPVQDLALNVDNVFQANDCDAFDSDVDEAPTTETMKLNDQVQSSGNTIRELREKISRLTKKHSDVDLIHDLKALDCQNKELHAKVNALHDLNKRWRAENKKVKRHYQELYDSIKIMRAHTIEKTNSLLTEVANLKAQLKENQKSNYVTMPSFKSKVLDPGRYVIDVEPIPLGNRNNRDVHLDYLKHLKESVATFTRL
nr:integrase, catalytic region, zinc finger, CCHC-type, peptidase aspartic, catalytic [Tanacetum cinerariifolium]